MIEERITRVQAIANIGGVSWNTAKKWTQASGFPTKGAGGWVRVEVEQWIAGRLKDAAKHQRGPDADLKRRKLSLQCAILEAKLKECRQGIARDSRDLVDFPLVVEELRKWSLHVWGALNSWVLLVGNSKCETGDQYGVVCGEAEKLLSGMKGQIELYLNDSELPFSDSHKEAITCFLTSKW